MRRRTKRTNTLPSSTIPTLELPEVSKTWSPTNLSAYPFTLRGAGAGEAPDQVTRGLIAFVKEKQIPEKRFLRLNEHSASYSHSPNKTQGTLPSRGTVHRLFWFSARSFGVWCQSWAIANMREESDARTEGAEMTTSPPSSSVLLAPAYACTYRP